LESKKEGRYEIYPGILVNTREFIQAFTLHIFYCTSSSRLTFFSQKNKNNNNKITAFTYSVHSKNRMSHIVCQLCIKAEKAMLVMMAVLLS
jgi:hypothetical protein